MTQTLGSVAVGTVVKINESGSPVDYLVVHQGLPSSMYDASCDGTWLLRQDIAENRVWDSGNSNVLESSDIQSYLNGTWINRYDTDIRNAIKQVKIPYRQNGGSSGTDRNGANGLSCKIFLLSGREVGWDSSDNQYFPNDGAKLDYFIDGTTSSANNKRIANLNGSVTLWWLRSPYTLNTSVVWSVNSGGNYNSWGANSSYGVRPAFVLSQNLYVLDDGAVSQFPGPAPSAITVPATSMVGTSIPVSWGTAPGADSYILQRKVDSGEWTQVYTGTATSYTDTAGSWSTVQYQVCGVFDGTNGDFAQSEVITVLPASSLVISGSDGDLGTITSDISYSVMTDTGNPISLTLTVNDAQFFSGSVGTSYASSIPVMDLPTGTNTIVITATVQTSNDPVTVTRTWTYTKAAQTFPGSGGLGQLAKDGQNVFPLTLAEAVKAIGGPWGGNLSTALNKLAMAATYSATTVPRYTEVNVNLSTAQPGDIVQLPVNGVMVPHIVVQVGNPDPSMYDSSCNGVWLLRQDIVENGQWNSTNVNTLEGSTIMATMQEYVDDYDPTVQAAIQTVKIPYCVGGGDTAVKTLENGLQCKMFPLSAQEIGCGDYPGTGAVPEDGVKLDYFPLGFDSSSAFVKRTANSNYWLRSPNPNGSKNVWFIWSSGSFSNNDATELEGIRPCFTLPVTFTATYYVDEPGNVYPEQEYTTAGDFYDLWGNVIPTVKIATGSYTGTGTTGSGNPNTLMFPFEPKVVFIQGEWSSSVDDAVNKATIICSSDFFETDYHEIGNSTGSQTTGGGVCNLTVDGNTISWYLKRAFQSTSDANVQLNHSGTTYYYVAIG